MSDNEMKSLRIKTLSQVSFALCLLFLSCIGISVLLAQSRAQSDAISHAEHEQLRADLEIHNVTIEAKIAVLVQRLADDELLIRRSAELADEHASTINRMEGIGISFGLALTVVQYMLFRAHQESRRNEQRISREET